MKKIILRTLVVVVAVGLLALSSPAFAEERQVLRLDRKKPVENIYLDSLEGLPAYAWNDCNPDNELCRFMVKIEVDSLQSNSSQEFPMGSLEVDCFENGEWRRLRWRSMEWGNGWVSVPARQAVEFVDPDGEAKIGFVPLCEKVNIFYWNLVPR